MYKAAGRGDKTASWIGTAGKNITTILTQESLSIDVDFGYNLGVKNDFTG